MGMSPNPYSPETGHGPPPYYYHPPPPPPAYLPPRKWFPWLVPTIIIINIVLFIISMYINNCPAHSDSCLFVSSLERFAFENTVENPLLGPSSATLLRMGALEVNKVVNDHELWKLLTCMWLHAGAFHLIANMLSLLFVGIRLEQEFGFVRVGVLYAVSGIGGSLLSALFVRKSISVGASGALFGLLGAMLSELLVNWTIYDDKAINLYAKSSSWLATSMHWFSTLSMLESFSSLVLIILVNLAVGILPHVDNFAHVGGFVTGFLLGFVLFVRPQFGYISKRHYPHIAASPKSKYKIYQFVLMSLSLVTLAAGLLVGAGLLIGGVDGNEHCSWCHYLSCVPTPFWSCESAQCTSIQYDEFEFKLTCMDNNKSKMYIAETGMSTSYMQQLCADLCQ